MEEGESSPPLSVPHEPTFERRQSEEEGAASDSDSVIEEESGEVWVSREGGSGEK